jgi:hypothetical protein
MPLMAVLVTDCAGPAGRAAVGAATLASAVRASSLPALKLPCPLPNPLTTPRAMDGLNEPFQEDPSTP